MLKPGLTGKPFNRLWRYDAIWDRKFGPFRRRRSALYRVSSSVTPISHGVPSIWTGFSLLSDRQSQVIATAVNLMFLRLMGRRDTYAMRLRFPISPKSRPASRWDHAVAASSNRKQGRSKERVPQALASQ